MLPVTGLILLWAMRGMKGQREYTELTDWEAFWIGLSQAAAIMPGLSRSGTTISTGLKLGLKPQAAATFLLLAGDSGHCRGGALDHHLTGHQNGPDDTLAVSINRRHCLLRSRAICVVLADQLAGARSAAAVRLVVYPARHRGHDLAALDIGVTWPGGGCVRQQGQAAIFVGRSLSEGDSTPWHVARRSQGTESRVPGCENPESPDPSNWPPARVPIEWGG